MSAGHPGIEPVPPAPAGDRKSLDPTSLRIALEPTSRADQLFSAASDWCSAILVKETRQSLKSRFFVWTFMLLLLVVGTWAVFSTAVAYGPAGEPAELGPVMLTGFFCILGFPLAIVIPFSAYRSMAHEYESGTLQMVTITTMRPYQIVAGKLGSAVLQIMMYLSVLAPCMAFTWLLRGIDMVQIGFGLGVAIFGSVCLCCVALLLACSTRRRTLGVGMTVLLIPALIWVYIMWCITVAAINFSGGEFTQIFQPIGRVMLWGMVAAVGSTALLAFVAAAGQIAAESENRTTGVRLVILVQQALFIGWIASLLGMGETPTRASEAFLIVSYVFCHYWVITGAMLCGSDHLISERVRRAFPASFLGQSLTGLLMPGTGRAYLFSLACLVGGLLVILSLAVVPEWLLMTQVLPSGSGFPATGSSAEAVRMVLMNGSYALFFLTVTFLVLQLIKRGSRQVGPLAGLLIAAFLIFLGTMVGYVIYSGLFRLDLNANYSLFQMFDWYRTVTASYRGVAGPETGWVCLILILVPLVLLAIRISCQDLRYGTLATPEQVLAAREARKRRHQAIPEETIEDIFHPRQAEDAPTAQPDSDEST